MQEARHRRASTLCSHYATIGLSQIGFSFLTDSIWLACAVCWHADDQQRPLL